ncbi:hypothetical protein CH63R_01751 [Colletotrichum higginsianum IMI 349063]|uniref:Uncharacterized protein n=1 Tax=Colletotrichum higginsianum (strain IMI 349063) TaxID=759273 RepID=A0A1B7YX22_COLHI|nr:hypothetical protein CH63R_01751 [Colletotrichum higginsianum IMI 349063]OBR16571.1 hypothetical protein CH63R_01751 [Colletotrichum higginsianum IMI 349063]
MQEGRRLGDYVSNLLKTSLHLRGLDIGNHPDLVAVSASLGAGPIAPHEGTVDVVQRAYSLAAGDVGDGLVLGFLVRLQFILGLELLVALHRGADTPLVSLGAAPAVFGLRLEGGLNEVAGAVQLGRARLEQ